LVTALRIMSRLLRQGDVGFPGREQLRLSRNGDYEDGCCRKRFDWEAHDLILQRGISGKRAARFRPQQRKAI
jgi:hypothetical protein